MKYYFWTIALPAILLSAENSIQPAEQKVVYKNRPIKISVINRFPYQHDGYYSYRQYYRSYYPDSYYYQYQEPRVKNKQYQQTQD